MFKVSGQYNEIEKSVSTDKLNAAKIIADCMKKMDYENVTITKITEKVITYEEV